MKPRLTPLGRCAPSFPLLLPVCLFVFPSVRFPVCPRVTPRCLDPGPASFRMQCRLLLYKRLRHGDCPTLPGGSLLHSKHSVRQLPPLPRGHILGVHGPDGELPVPDVHDRQLLSGGLHISDELLAREVPAVRGRDGCQRMPGLRARVGVRVGRHVGNDNTVSACGDISRK